MAKHKTNTSQLKAIKAIAKASLVSTLRNPTAVFFSFLFPFIFIFAFGLLGQGDQTFKIVLREDSAKSGAYYDAIKDSEVLKIDEELTDSEIDEELERGGIPVAITIRENEAEALPFSYHIEIERSAADPQNAQTVVFILETIGSKINQSVQESQDIPQLITSEQITVEGRKFTQIDFILPGQLAFALLASAVNGLALTFITLKKELVIKRIFATPAKRSSIIYGEVISRAVVAIMQAVIIISVGYFFLDFTLANGIVTFFEMLFLCLIGLIVFLGIGMFVSSLGEDEEAIAPAANLLTLPQFILSGAFFPIDAFPEFIQPVARIMPMTFLNDALRAVAFEGDSLISTFPQIGALIIWGIIIYAIAIRTFKWE